MQGTNHDDPELWTTKQKKCTSPWGNIFFLIWSYHWRYHSFIECFIMELKRENCIGDAYIKSAFSWELRARFSHCMGPIIWASFSVPDAKFVLSFTLMVLPGPFMNWRAVHHNQVFPFEAWVNPWREKWLKHCSVKRHYNFHTSEST